MHCYRYCAINIDNVYQGRIWAYTSVLLNLDNSCKIGKNLQEHINEDLEEASKEWLRPQLDKSYAAYGETKQMELTHFDGYAMLDAIEFGAKWKEQQITAKDIDGKLYSTLCGSEQNVVDYVGYSEYGKRLK